MIYPQSQDLESEDFAEETLTADDKKNPAPHGMYKNPVNDGIIFIPSGAASQPSTVLHRNHCLASWDKV